MFSPSPSVLSTPLRGGHQTAARGNGNGNNNSGTEESMAALTASTRAKGNGNKRPKTSNDAVTVAIRVRPLSDADRNGNRGGHLSVQALSSTQLHQEDLGEYTFDHVFHQDTSQSDIMDAIGKPFADSCLNGFNGCILAYGATGSGKSYTMMGGAKSETKGLIPRILSCVFDRLTSKALGLNPSISATQAFKDNYIVKVSMMEIYNENCYDLLRSESINGTLTADHTSSTASSSFFSSNINNTNNTNGMGRSLEVRGDSENGFRAEGLTEISVQSVNEAEKILFNGISKRTVASTKMNEFSSRSHCIFIFSIYNSDQTLISTLKLVDLAGSENSSKSGTNEKNEKNNDKTLQTEGKNINKSLLELTKVVRSIVKKDSKITYRSSKLTMILKDCLDGQAKTIFIAAVCPSSMSASETKRTIQFATTCQKMESRLKTNLFCWGKLQPLVNELTLAQKFHPTVRQIFENFWAKHRESWGIPMPSSTASVSHPSLVTSSPISTNNSQWQKRNSSDAFDQQDEFSTELSSSSQRKKRRTLSVSMKDENLIPTVLNWLEKSIEEKQSAEIKDSAMEEEKQAFFNQFCEWELKMKQQNELLTQQTKALEEKFQLAKEEINLLHKENEELKRLELNHVNSSSSKAEDESEDIEAGNSGKVTYYDDALKSNGEPDFVPPSKRISFHASTFAAAETASSTPSRPSVRLRKSLKRLSRRHNIENNNTNLPTNNSNASSDSKPSSIPVRKHNRSISTLYRELVGAKKKPGFTPSAVHSSLQKLVKSKRSRKSLLPSGNGSVPATPTQSSSSTPSGTLTDIQENNGKDDNEMNASQFIYSQSQKNSISSSTADGILSVNLALLNTSPSINSTASGSQFSSPSVYSYRYSTLKDSSMHTDVTQLSELVARMEEHHQNEASNGNPNASPPTPATPITLRFIR